LGVGWVLEVVPSDLAFFFFFFCQHELMSQREWFI